LSILPHNEVGTRKRVIKLHRDLGGMPLSVWAVLSRYCFDVRRFHPLFHASLCRRFFMSPDSLALKDLCSDPKD